VLLATATRGFPEVRTHAAPFYDFFQERRLDELTVDEVGDLVERRARWDKATELLEHPEELRPRLAALFHLSGGNPRLVIALYGVLRGGVTREIHEQLLQLLDDVTPYYQARLHDASPQGERVLAEMATADGPLLPSELGRRCGLKTNQVTAVLAQLQEERFVAPGGRPADKRARYWEVTDRLFRIWLQMREQEGSERTVRWIVEFYQRWYGDDRKTLLADVERLAKAAWGGGVEGFSDFLWTVEHMRAAGHPVPFEFEEIDPAHEEEARSAFESGEAERRRALAVPLAWTAFRAKDLAAVDRYMDVAVEMRSSDVCRVIPELYARRSAEGLRRLDQMQPCRARDVSIAILALIGRDLDRLQELLGNDPGVQRIAAVFLSALGRADLLLPNAELFKDIAGPRAVLARVAAGQPMTGVDLRALKKSDARLLAANVARGIQETFRRGGTDDDAARLEAVIPVSRAADRARLRAVRTRSARAAAVPFDPGLALDPKEVLAGWSAEPWGLPDPTPANRPPLLWLYEELRDLGLLPVTLSPWSDALAVHAARDRDDALSALFPEVREAVALVLREQP
jgi:DNA-binding MarR family transcriptional regulator